MTIKKQLQTSLSDTQVEQIIEEAVGEEGAHASTEFSCVQISDSDAFGDIPVVDDLYKQDEYWTDAIDLKVFSGNDRISDAIWSIDVKEGDLLEHGSGLTPIELDSSEFEYDNENQIMLKYADQFEW